MAFKLKSGNKVDFKSMGSSPVRNMKDGSYSQSFEKPGPPQATKFKHNWDEVDESKNTLERGSTSLTENKGFGGDAVNLIQAKKEENKEINDAVEGDGVKKDADGNVVTKETTESSAGTKLGASSSKYEENGDLKEGGKKWHEKDSFRDTGVGHITDAVKSISRGIKNIRAKNKTKNAKKLALANEAVKDGTQTFKQQKTADRAIKKGEKKEDRKAKDQKKLTKYKAKKSKKAVKKFKNNTVVKNGKTYSKNNTTAKSDYSNMSNDELMAEREKRTA